MLRYSMDMVLYFLQKVQIHLKNSFRGYDEQGTQQFSYMTIHIYIYLI